jgi:hypothetical protein
MGNTIGSSLGTSVTPPASYFSYVPNNNNFYNNNQNQNPNQFRAASLTGDTRPPATILSTAPDRAPGNIRYPGNDWNYFAQSVFSFFLFCMCVCILIFHFS